MVYSKMTPVERFFWLHAGFSFNPRCETRAQGRRKCAVAMAQAEVYAKNQQWEFVWWKDDNDIDSLGDHEYWCSDAKRGIAHEHAIYYCQLLDSDTVLESLYGIIDPNSSYRRVVEAELALEAMANIESQQRNERAVYSYCAL